MRYTTTMEDNTLATELLHEVKAIGKRWFIAFLVMIALEIFTIIGFIWYIQQPVDNESTQIDQQANEHSVNIIGGDYVGDND